MSGSNTMDMTSGFASEAARQSFPLVGREAAYETVASLSLFPSPSLPPPSLLPPSLPQVALLKDVLEEWKKEVDKKPPEMSVDQAYDALGLKTGVGGSVHRYTDLIFLQ